MRVWVDNDIKYEGTKKFDDEVHGLLRDGGHSSFNKYDNYGGFGDSSQG